MAQTLGIDIGGSGIKGALVDTESGELATERHRIPTPRPATPDKVAETVRLLVELARERELTLVVSLHNIELAREFFPRLVGLREGKVAFDKQAREASDSEFHQLYELADAI